ncbi:hypothetical protein QR680_019008 [Steinernema hermaphroditum]|uniref:Sulfotransferase domain-containing protein n=1 Tax=Steinernema hermaphroditum TaxID=289476 RepID=A0AA39HKN8_9BILA|nr:hypothetical protein QR680_019008 [Steinernema hermaphroditum]
MENSTPKPSIGFRFDSATIFHVLYLVFCRIFFALQLVYRRWTETATIPTGHARVSAIVYRRKRDPEEIASTDDFVTIHESFKPLDFLDSHWAIYCVDRNYALFVELPQPTTYYEAKRFPFCYIPFFEEATRVAYVTIDDFVAHCESLGESPQPRTILFTNTARCGSTLMAQMLSLDGVTVCFAEPYVLTNLSIGYVEGFYTEEFLKRVLPAAITYLRKDLPSEQICVLKTASTEARLVPFTEGIPNLQHIFMFRKNGLPSVERVVLRDKAMASMLKLYEQSPQISNMISWLFAGDGDFVRKLKPTDMLEHAAIVYAAPYAHYLKNKKKYTTIVWYHDVMEDAEKTTSGLFEKLDIPQDCVPLAMKCKSLDSQDGTFLSRKALSGIKTSQVTEEHKKRLIHFAKVMEIPKEVFLGEE